MARTLSADRAARILRGIRPKGASASLRRQLASEVLRDIRTLDRKIADLNGRIEAEVEASGTTLTGIFGIGPILAARIIGTVGDVRRFPTKAHFASYSGTAPLEASSGEVVRYRTAAWLAWSLWALSVALTALSLVLLALIRAHPGTHVFDWWLGNSTIVIDATVGAIVASRRPENPVGWLLCLSGVATSTSTFTSQYAIYALLAQPNSLPAGEAMAWISAWTLPIMNGVQVFYPLLFPTGRLPSRRWRWLALLTVAYILVGGSLLRSLRERTWVLLARYATRSALRASPSSTKRFCTLCLLLCSSQQPSH